MPAMPHDGAASANGTSSALVSIYIPTRNRVRSLDKAVESVLSQSYRNVELIVVNDASDDGTQEYLLRKAEMDPRLLPLTNERPCGAAASRNIAILKAKGAFVTGLDDDDCFLPQRISAFMDYWHLLTAQGARPACLFAQDICIDSGICRAITRKRSSVTAEQLLEYNYIGNQVFAPRDHFLEAGLFDTNMPAWQDLDFLIRLLKRFGTAHLLDAPTYLFDVTMRPDRISLQEKKIRKAFERIACKHADHPGSRKSFFLQMFQEGYGLSPGVGDWLHFLSWKGFPKGMIRMLRASWGWRYEQPVPSGAVARAGEAIISGGVLGGD